MQIHLSQGSGVGPTEISAFDLALVHAGIANHNLIYLSSVLPPGSEIIQDGEPPETGEWGDRLYVVMAQHRRSSIGESWAGIGWIQQEDGRGLLVEHEGESEAGVREAIEHSLQALARNRDMQFGPIQMKVCGAISHGQPVCALVAAVFESNSWQTATT